ncbi:zinc dependent phospholipase C family protein [Flavobacterium gilvum]|uniref:S1/P1 Nuclease n=1 Tax=Flavobacterium gilvum TaxID=1492737 RepID=A0AAC9I6V0_9FLAO|nr:zinc dependent phospholipase C family protein [Flavobacterium gilvum]AOW10068.1 S1/P1 Nuclease [Flavobacterium gilvum]
MKNFKFKQTVLVFSAISIAFITLSWGVFGHEHINNAAVMALPKPIQTFFYNHIDFITQESSIPDLRKYVLHDKAENPRHYMDMENFGDIDAVPLAFEDVKKKYDDKFLADNGILPWYIQETMAKLTKAMKDKRKNEILFLAGDLAHYIGDANMPLHTSANHDGQLSNQKGIHSMWESRIPELFGKNYNFYTGEAKYIDNVEKATWDMLKDSHSQVEPLLAIDKKLRSTFTTETMYEKDEKGNIAKNKYNEMIYSKEYVTQFHSALNGMVEKQMRKAIVATANFWYTAWVNAGKPNLDNLDSKELTNRNKKNLQNDLKLWKTGKVFGLESESEF